jgi:hypothetical protein
MSYIFYQNGIEADKRKKQALSDGFPEEIHKVFHIADKGSKRIKASQKPLSQGPLLGLRLQLSGLQRA